MTEQPSRSDRRDDAELVLLSVFILYLELLLIRWVGTEIRIFAYLGNVILVVCFFGVGLGCFLSSSPRSLTRMGISLALLTILVANPLHVGALDMSRVSYLLGSFEDSPLWFGGLTMSKLEVVAGLVIIAVLTYLVTIIMVPLGGFLGRAFERHPRTIKAYSLNIAGSLIGVWLFSFVSWQDWPPAVWFLVAAVLVGLLAVVPRNRYGWPVIAFVLVAAAAAWLGRERDLRVIWSPYHKLALSPLYVGDGTNRVQQGFILQANGSYYQQVVDLSDTFLDAHPALFDRDKAALSHYNLAFAIKPEARRVLVLGSGMGNNAAAALRHGATEIDCVEIDPEIAALGRELHPEHPYSSPRVHMTIDDARAFFKRATGTYDLIWFALLDSRVLGSSYNNLRLDHYIYTIESFREARRLLAPNGVIIVNFDPERIWIADRMYVVMREVFGHPPLVISKPYVGNEYGGGGYAIMVCGDKFTGLEAVAEPIRGILEKHVAHMTGTTRPTTDDWPYLYLEHARIPKLHWLTSLSILAGAMLVSQRAVGFRRGIDWHFFALGAAFLLLEVQTVSRAMLLFGMTWEVNSFVITAVLVMILLANWLAANWPGLPRSFCAAGLAITLLLLGTVPLDWFNTLPLVSKLIAAGCFLTAPVFFGGLLFIRSFATCADKSRALGSNLIGALVGGLLESVSYMAGMRALVILAALLYTLALWQTPDRGKAET